jgi:outer membrane protein TolC
MTPLVARAQAVPTLTTIPEAPEVSDAMLRPAPRAKREVATWDEALRYLRSRSTELHIAVQEVARAEGQQRVALAGMLPTVTGIGTYTRNLITSVSTQNALVSVGSATSSVAPDYVEGAIALVQPLFAPRAWYALHTASLEIEKEKLELDDERRLLAMSAANAMVGVVAAERVAELNRAGLLNALQRLELTTRKVSYGGATGIDIVRARQDVEVARDTLVAGDEALRQARESLGLALGFPEQVGVPPTLEIHGLSQDASASCRPAPGVDARPDVAALRAQLAITHREVNDAKFEYVPTVNLQTYFYTTNLNTGDVPNTTWNVQAVLTVPIWDGGARYGHVRVNRALEIEAVETLEAQKRKAAIEIEQARRAIELAEERHRVAAVARDLAVEGDRLSRLAYQEGRATSLELVTAAQQLRAAEIMLVLRDFDLVKARILGVLTLASCSW